MILFAGCNYKGYSGEHTDLFTVAINSILWNCGHSYGADFAKDSEIEIIDRDEFGRILFRYQEKFYSAGTMKLSALIVSQYTFDSQVYYYEDCNYIVKDRSVSLTFEQEEIERLKGINDWGKPINVDKCIGKTIIKKKHKNAEIESAVKDRVITEYKVPDYRHLVYADYLTEDKNGNCIFYGVIALQIYEKVIFFVAFVNADGDIKLFTPSELFNYNEELKNFKAENGWESK